MIENIIKYQLDETNLTTDNRKSLRHILREKIAKSKSNWGVRNELLTLWGLDMDEDTPSEARE